MLRFDAGNLDERQQRAFEWFTSLDQLSQAFVFAHACDYASTQGVTLSQIKDHLKSDPDGKMGQVENTILEGLIDARRQNVV
mgnify:CR=1 FL=1